jgi:hypothetical protein
MTYILSTYVSITSSFLSLGYFFILLERLQWIRHTAYVRETEETRRICKILKGRDHWDRWEYNTVVHVWEIHCEDVNLNSSEQGSLASTMKLVCYFTTHVVHIWDYIYLLVGILVFVSDLKTFFSMSVVSIIKNILLASPMNYWFFWHFQFFPLAGPCETGWRCCSGGYHGRA